MDLVHKTTHVEYHRPQRVFMEITAFGDALRIIRQKEGKHATLFPSA